MISPNKLERAAIDRVVALILHVRDLFRPNSEAYQLLSEALGHLGHKDAA